MATVVGRHPNPKPNLQGIDARLLLQDIQYRLGLVGLRRTVVHPADDACKHLFLPKLHDDTAANLELWLQTFGHLVGKHPWDRYRQDDVHEIVSAGSI